MKGDFLNGSIFWPAVKVLLEDPNILANTYVYELVKNFDTSSEELALSPQNIVHIRKIRHIICSLCLPVSSCSSTAKSVQLLRR
jgi:hypothetical protein